MAGTENPRADGAPKASGNKKVANSLVALSSAAVLAVYSAGYVRTKAAAERLETAAQRRPHLPMPAPDAVAANIAADTNAATLALPAASLDRGAIASPSGAASPVERDHPTSIASNPAPLSATAASVEATNADVSASSAANVPSVSQPVTVPTEPVASIAKVEPAPVAAPVAPAIPAASLPVQQTERSAAPVAPPATPVPAAAPSAGQWKDGKYLGWGYSRHGDIQAQVVIENGRIAYAVIAKCLTRYSCSIIDHLQKQVAQRQGPEVDYVAGATESADAFYGAVVEALKQAR